LAEASVHPIQVPAEQEQKPEQKPEQPAPTYTRVGKRPSVGTWMGLPPQHRANISQPAPEVARQEEAAPQPAPQEEEQGEQPPIVQTYSKVGKRPSVGTWMGLPPQRAPISQPSQLEASPEPEEARPEQEQPEQEQPKQEQPVPTYTRVGKRPSVGTWMGLPPQHMRQPPAPEVARPVQRLDSGLSADEPAKDANVSATSSVILSDLAEATVHHLIKEEQREQPPIVQTYSRVGKRPSVGTWMGLPPRPAVMSQPASSSQVMPAAEEPEEEKEEEPAQEEQKQEPTPAFVRASKRPSVGTWMALPPQRAVQQMPAGTEADLARLRQMAEEKEKELAALKEQKLAALKAEQEAKANEEEEKREQPVPTYTRVGKRPSVGTWMGFPHRPVVASQPSAAEAKSGFAEYYSKHFGGAQVMETMARSKFPRAKVSKPVARMDSGLSADDVAKDAVVSATSSVIVSDLAEASVHPIQAEREEEEQRPQPVYASNRKRPSVGTWMGVPPSVRMAATQPPEPTVQIEITEVKPASDAAGADRRRPSDAGLSHALSERSYASQLAIGTIYDAQDAMSSLYSDMERMSNALSDEQLATMGPESTGVPLRLSEEEQKALLQERELEESQRKASKGSSQPKGSKESSEHASEYASAIVDTTMFEAEAVTSQHSGPAITVGGSVASIVNETTGYFLVRPSSGASKVSVDSDNKQFGLGQVLPGASKAMEEMEREIYGAEVASETLENAKECMTISSVACDRISASAISGAIGEEESAAEAVSTLPEAVRTEATVTPREEALLPEPAEAEEEEVMELFFDAPYDEIDHEEFKVGVRDGLKEFGCSNENLKKVTIDLRPGSTVADIRGPTSVISAVKACPLNNFTVLGYQAFESLGDLEAYQAAEKAKAGKRLFSKIDANDDGVISRQEFDSAMASGMLQAPQESSASAAAPARQESKESAYSSAAAKSSSSRGAEDLSRTVSSSAGAHHLITEITPVARIRPGHARLSITGIELLQEDSTQQLHFQEIRELIRQRDEVVVAAAVAKSPEEASELEEQLELLEASLQEAREEYVAMYEQNPRGENQQ